MNERVWVVTLAGGVLVFLHLVCRRQMQPVVCECDKLPEPIELSITGGSLAFDELVEGVAYRLQTRHAVGLGLVREMTFRGFRPLGRGKGMLLLFDPGHVDKAGCPVKALICVHAARVVWISAICEEP